VPYMSCPSCRLTHYEAATAIITQRVCPRCERKLGIESVLFESPTLPDARARLARLAAVDGVVAATSTGGPAAAAG
jgi:predicted RNA polymerase sigma factor